MHMNNNMLDCLIKYMTLYITGSISHMYVYNVHTLYTCTMYILSDTQPLAHT